MDVASSAVGIASLGIQVCRGLLTYYDAWRVYNSDMSSVYDSIDDLGRTLALLKASLESDKLDEEKKDRVKRCLHSCEKSLVKLSEKAQKLRKCGQPDGFRQTAWAELQRAWYPFRASSLAKLREIVAEVQEQLKLAVQVLQLDTSTTSQRILKSLAADTSNLVNRTEAIATSVAHISAQNQQILDLQQSDPFKKIKVWLSAPDPWTNHAAARQRHEPHTGSWLLQSDQYQRWKASCIHHLWLYGKAGCGKTVLCSTMVEDIRVYCESREDTMYAAFYFTFSDNQKQSYENLLRSLVAQVGWKEPGLSMLVHACEKPNASFPEVDELERILISCGRSHRGLFLLLDALDECPESSEARQNVLNGLERLGSVAPNIRILVTSREVNDVGESMQALGADSVCIAAQFRWVYCQLQELKKLKSTRPSHVREALSNLPETLDETYERMLTRIEKISRKDALVLRWLTYAHFPLTLGELAETRVIDLEGDGSVDVDDRGGLEDLLAILSGLVTIEGIDNVHGEMEASRFMSVDSEESNTDVTNPVRRVETDAKVRFAHFSVKEYLESERILQSDAKTYYMESAREHTFLAQSCLTYLMQYSCNLEKTSTRQDLTEFPLLKYAARSWSYHSSLRQSSGVSRETIFLNSKTARRDWLLIYQSDKEWAPFDKLGRIGSSVYYASFFGLSEVVQELLKTYTDVNARGGVYGNALQAASVGGYEEVVYMLLDAGANVNAQGGYYGNALQAASVRGHENLVRVLLDRDADANAQRRFHGNMVQAFEVISFERLLRMTINAGYTVSMRPGGGIAAGARGEAFGNALQAASLGGYKKVVEILLNAGADANAQGGFYGNALNAASIEGHERVVRILLDRGANADDQGGPIFRNALQAASVSGHVKVVSTLLDAGANANAQGGAWGNALQAASTNGYIKVVQMLIEHGADVSAQGGTYGNALQGASFGGKEKIVEILIERGADVNVQGGQHGNASQAASLRGHKKVVSMLLERGAYSL